MGTSMGGMHTWLWGERYPDLHGRAHAARQPARPRSPAATAPGGGSSIDAIRNDPAWKGGDYTAQPREPAHRGARCCWLVGSNPVLRQKERRRSADADRALDALRRRAT